jgi:hypothetical protein
MESALMPARLRKGPKKKEPQFVRTGVPVRSSLVNTDGIYPRVAV